jgi:cell division septal protein FtsQ
MGSRWTLLLTASLPLIAALVSLPFTAKAKEPLRKLTGMTFLIVTVYLIVLWWLVYPVSAKMVTIG